MKTMEEEEKEPLRSETQLQHEVRHLKDLLAEKDEQIRKEVGKQKKIIVAHRDTITQLTSTEAELQESKQRCAGLVEKLLHHRDVHVPRHTQGEDMDTLHKELSKEEEALKRQLLEREQQLEEQMSQRCSMMEEAFHKRLLKERERFKEELLEMEESLVRLSEKMDHSLNRQLSMLREHWETRAQRWDKDLLELQEEVQEGENLLKEQEENKKEMELLREELQQLQLNADKKKRKVLRWRK